MPKTKQELDHEIQQVLRTRSLDLRTDAEKLDALIAKIETIVPYVQGTLGVGARIPSAHRPDWVEIHGGRAVSSERQLESLLKMARELRA